MRLHPNNVDVLDHYLLPSIDMKREKLKIAEENGLGLDAYRFDDLTEFYSFVSPIYVSEAA